MTNDPLHTQHNIEEFRRRRKRQLSVSLPFLLIFIASLWLRDHPEQTPLGMTGNSFVVVFLAAIAGILIFSFKNWRCPACDGYLGKGFNPSFCPKCGAQLR